MSRPGEIGWSLIVLAAAGLLLAAAQAGMAQPPARTTESQVAPERTIIQPGQSMVIVTPWPVSRVSVTDPAVADVEVLTPTQVLVMGRRLGSTDILLWSAAEQMQRTLVTVELDLQALGRGIGDMFPGSAVDVSQRNNVLVLSGVLRRAEDVSRLEAFLDAAGITYVNNTGVAGIQQVLLQVRVAEVSRAATRALGINAFHTSENFFGASTIGPSGSGAINPISIGPPGGADVTRRLPFMFTNTVGVSPAVTIFGGLPRADLEFFIQALAENQYLRILAEPNLVALSGEEASFLAGGEFPIPVPQAGGAGGGVTVTIEYREFGVRLRFRPLVLGDNTIRLFVAPEVSELTDVGAVELQGFRIPGVFTRRAATTLELSSGQSFAMAGLLNQRTDARNSRVPLLGDLPVIGSLFRSVRYANSETELVVMVTATLVEPLSEAAGRPLPGFLHTPPSDWELYATGRLEGATLPALSPADAAWLREMGLDQLHGPGAWANHGQHPGASRGGGRPVRTTADQPAPLPDLPDPAID